MRVYLHTQALHIYAFSNFFAFVLMPVWSGGGQGRPRGLRVDKPAGGPRDNHEATGQVEIQYCPWQQAQQQPPKSEIAN